MLTDPQERGLYDSWRSAGIAMRFSAWRNLKSSVRSSMHWATPRTSGRMLDMVDVAYYCFVLRHLLELFLQGVSLRRVGGVDAFGGFGV